MKKVLSLVLVIAMVLSSFSFAFAANFEDVEGDYEKAINTLVGLGVVTGYEDGTYRPERIVTRAEMAKLIVEILGYGDLVAGSASNFADTQGHWADSWIALAAGRGLVVGTGDGNFTPDRQVSYDEAITMIVRALGYTDDCNELKGMTWPTNFKVKAADLKLTKDVKIVGTGADRGGVAQLLFNALEANMVTVDTDGNVNYVKDGEDNKILLNALAKKDRFVVAPKHLDKDDKAYMGDIVDLAPYMYQDIKVFVNDDDEVVYVTKVESEVKVGEFRKTDKEDDGKVFIRIDGKNKAYDLFKEEGKDISIPVYYNGVEIKLDEEEMETGDTNLVDLHKADATFVLNDAGDIVAIVANKYTEAARVTNEYNGRTKIEGFALPLDDDDKVDYDKLTVIGEVDTLEDIEEDDVIVLFAGAGEKTTSDDTEKLVIQVVRNTVEGKITRTNSDGQFYIDGKYYTKSQFADWPFEVGEEGTYFLDHKGQLVDFEEDDADEPKDYAVVVEVLDGVYAGPVGEGRVIADAEITLVNAQGEELTYNFDNKAKVGNEYVFKGRLVGGVYDTAVDSNADLVVNTDLNAFDVIKYTVNSKGKISKITIERQIADLPVVTKPDQDITGKSYVFASNVVIFNYDDGDVDVVDFNKLGDEVDIITSKENKNGEIEMFFVKGLGTTSTYAYIVDEGTMWNDDDERVQTLVAYVNGVEVFYETDIPYSATKVGYVTDVDNATIVELDLDGDIVTGIVGAYAVLTTPTAVAGNIVAGDVTRISGDRIQVGDDWYVLADDISVYILDDGEFDEVGDASSVYYDANIAGFAFDDDNVDDGVIEILFIFEGEEPAEDPEPDPDPATGEVTYISADGTKVDVDDKQYTLVDGLEEIFDDHRVELIGSGVEFVTNNAGEAYAVKSLKLEAKTTYTNTLLDKLVAFDGITVTGQGTDKTTVTGNVVVAGKNVTITKVKVAGDLTVTGDNFTSKDNHITGNVVVNGDNASFNTEIDGNVVVNGEGATFSNVTIGGDFLVNEDVTVSGSTTVAGTITVASGVVIDASKATDEDLQAAQKAAEQEKYFDYTSGNTFIRAELYEPTKTDRGLAAGFGFVFKEWTVNQLDSLKVILLNDGEEVAIATLKNTKSHTGKLLSGAVYTIAKETDSWLMDRTVSGEEGYTIYNSYVLEVVKDGVNYTFTYPYSVE